MTPSQQQKKLVFVSRSIFLASAIPGGVQICTREFVKGFSRAGFDICPFPIKTRNSLLTRIKVKLGVDSYSEGEVARFASDLIHFIEKEKAKYVALNLTHLAQLAKPLRHYFGDKIRIVLLSHGNESGDFLYQALDSKEKKACLTQIKETYRLGGLILHEAFYRQYIDHVFVISEVENEIEKWLGSKGVTFIPRILKPDFLDWQPRQNYLGYIGTLDHPPNRLGLMAVLEALEKKGISYFRLRVVGGPPRTARQYLLKYPNVDYLGELSNAQLREEARTWAVFLHPIFWYARGASTKLAQGISWGIPIVTTHAGSRGYCWNDGSLIFADTPQDMVNKILHTTQSTDSLEKAALEVKKVAQNGPDVNKIADMLFKGLSDEERDT